MNYFLTLCDLPFILLLIKIYLMKVYLRYIYNPIFLKSENIIFIFCISVEVTEAWTWKWPGAKWQA